MIFSHTLKTIEKFTQDNSPAILTAVGATGTVLTALLTHKAALKADWVIEQKQRAIFMHEVTPPSEPLVPLSSLEKVKLVWPIYVPPMLMGTLTITCTIGANRIGSRRTAAVAAAYSLSEKAFDNYRDKVIEKLGANKERAVRDEVAQEIVRQNPQSESNVVIIGTGEVLCCDLFTKRYFRSSVEELKKAMNDTNYQVNNNLYASLSDFYDRVGLPRTSYSDEVGWKVEKLLDLEFTTILAEDGQPCVAFSFRVSPVRDYHRLL